MSSTSDRDVKLMQTELNEDFLKEFQIEYRASGPNCIEKQTPYLAALARSYEDRATVDPKNNWTDVLKAHALYNSCAVRDSPGKWSEEAYRVQQLYWREDVNISYQEQAEITESLKSELQSIRDTCRRCLVSPSAEVEKWETDIEKLIEMGTDRINNETSSFVRKMKIVSKICNDKMLQFSSQCIEKAVNLCGEIPCKFAVVSLGSMARGEATPYSDWEFLFLIYNTNAKAISYFELLAMTIYFLIGNLGETELKYMNVAELKGWFVDRTKSGFRIDGLKDKAGNIPTGNGLDSQKKNKFILTPGRLKKWYAEVLAKPVANEAVKGDLTAMLASTVLVYGDEDLLEKFVAFKADCKLTSERVRANFQMLDGDRHTYSALKLDSRLMDVKEEIYRYPSLFLLNLKILFGLRSSNSWDVIQELKEIKLVQPQLESSLKFMLAAALYIRLSMYLHYDSRHDQMLLSVENEEPSKQSQWILPYSLRLHLSMHTDAVQQRKVNDYQADLPSFMNYFLDNPLWKNISLNPIESGIILTFEMSKCQNDLEQLDKYIDMAMKTYLPVSSEGSIPLWLNLVKIHLLISKDKYQQAIEIAKQCFDSDEVKWNKHHQMSLEILLCDTYLLMKNKTSCIHHAREYSSKVILQLSLNDSERILYLYSWANINAQIGQEDEALNMYTEALKLATASGAYTWQLHCSYETMLLYFKNSMMSEALDVATQVRTLVSEADFYPDHDMKIKDSWAKVVALAAKNATDQHLRDALSEGYQLLQELDQIPADLRIATMRQIIDLHMKLGEYKQALILLEQVYVLILNMGLGLKELEWCLTDGTTCHLLLGEMDEAATTYEAALAVQFRAQLLTSLSNNNSSSMC